MTSRQTTSATLIWSRTDWGLLIGGLGLSLIGALLVWSATRHQFGSAYLARHLLFTSIGLGLAAGGVPALVRALELIEEEVRICLGLLGITSFAALTPQHITAAHPVTEPGALSAFPLLGEYPAGGTLQD